MKLNKNLQLCILIGTLICYSIYFMFFYLFPTHFSNSDVRFASLIVEAITFVSLIYSIYSKKVSSNPFWICITIAIGSFLLGKIVYTYQDSFFKIPIHRFTISDVFYMLFLLFCLIAFCYKILKECDKWEKAFFICDICIVLTSIFTLEWYLFNQPNLNIFSLSLGDVFLSFLYPIADLLFLLLGVSLFFRPTIFNSKRKIYIFIFVLISSATFNYIYFYLNNHLSTETITLLRLLYRIPILLIAIAGSISEDRNSHKNYFIVNPIIGKKALVVFPYLAVAILIGFTLKEQTSSSTLITGNCITFIFVLIRHSIVRMQNNSLTKRLQAFNAQLEEKVTLRTSDLVHKSEALSQKQQKFKSLYEYHPDPIFTIDLNGVFLNVNKAGSILLGAPTDELLGETCFSIILDEDKYKLASALEKVKQQESASLQLSSQYKDGFTYSLYVTIVPIMIDGQISGSYIMMKDITALKKQQEEIKYLAFHDTVTKIGNRAFFHKKLKKIIKNAKTTESEFALLYLDLDRFKAINDTLGHSAGDYILEEVAKRFQSCLPSHTHLSRIGGDEFTILIENYTDEDSLFELCNQLFECMEKSFVIYEHTLTLSLSIGIAIYPHSGIDTATLLKNANVAMYDAKAKELNSVSIYDDVIAKKIERRLRLEKDLPNAIQNEELFLLYQPQVDSKSNKIIGAEALIRWNHPELGVISPYEFIPIAEETLQIIPIGKWTLQQACEQMKRWHTSGYSHLKIGVNLSAKEFEQEDFVKSISATLTNTGLPASSLDLELTERIAMMDERETLIKLRTLKSLGVHISIDDFGTGYSSLAYLPLYPIDTLKIPREFITMSETCDDGMEIIKTIITLANTLGMSVIAEGVETKEHVSFLQKNNCQFIQGYYYSKPIHADSFSTLLKKGVRYNH
ncbi:TPA: EAL domain-containing protein [Bacillus cereus]|uniref:Diguanylate cyclase domain protein n=2 Tax=Bacillus cereus group TaxID=86661 RepID=A0A0B5P1P6_BACTU|nr:MULTISPECIES: EAL domain-containing protein [Bacillus]ACK92438.1 sensory box/GGDEF family protein [Bacillus cereus AH820]AJG78413.1 diguanylate cyclase domain protein [Bacillus thuringiensis]AJH62359.1 diguanylate cyclase domain protein [Bacillus cereus]AJK32829.1 diguanylate cyclase domain protein [Bacillus cereus]KAA0744822.1 GGDEF domain-containing protein [Bacillus sp. AY1-10]